MSVAPVFAYGYIASLVVGAIPGCVIPGFAFVAATFRPDRDPDLIVMLYDWCLLSYVGSLGCFVTQNMVLALAIFLDRNDVLPKWLAYMSIWMIVTELLAAPVFVFKSGPLAWNGSISFWLGTVVFVVVGGLHHLVCSTGRSSARRPTSGSRTDMANATEAVETRPGRRIHLPADGSMWVFVLGDLVIFGAYFLIFMIYRNQEHQLFLDSQRHLSLDHRHGQHAAVAGQLVVRRQRRARHPGGRVPPRAGG